MKARYLLLTFAVALLALSGGPPPLKFIHPRARIVLSGPGGAETPWQVWAERHADNRAIHVQWWGDGCSGSFAREMHGEASPRLFPEDGFRIVRIYPGVCQFTASVYGPGAKLRYRATLEVCATGGETSC